MFINENGLILDRGGRLGSVSFGSTASDSSYAAHGFYPLDSDSAIAFPVTEELIEWAVKKLAKHYIVMSEQSVSIELDGSSVTFSGGIEFANMLQTVYNAAVTFDGEPQTITDVNGNEHELMISDLLLLLQSMFSIIKPNITAAKHAKLEFVSCVTVGDVMIVLGDSYDE